MKHYVCVVDLLGRAGLLAEAEELINSMPMESNAAVYEHSCIPVKYMEILNWVGKLMLELEQESGHYASLSNIYSKAGNG